MRNTSLKTAATGLTALLALSAATLVLQAQSVAAAGEPGTVQTAVQPTAVANAREALKQAMEAHSSGDHETVEAQLAQASQWLDKVEPGADAKTVSEVRRLRSEIHELVELETHKTPAAETELGGFWHRTAGLIERDAEQLYHAWRDQQSDNHLYRLLVDAKLHLFYAEHELFESRDAEGAAQELDLTIGYLKEAAQQTTGARREQIAAVEREVESLGPLAANPDEAARQMYDRALADLREMLEHK